MSVRIDKWLWAARFFKTRSKAKESIDGGKVHLNGHRTKPSKDIAIGDILKITQGYDEKVINVLVLSENRRAASIAQTLYEETEDSVRQRELRAEQRRAAGQHVASEGRPTKKDRRMIHRFLDNNQG